MTATYHHDHINRGQNPDPLTHDALEAAANALSFAAQGMGPLVRANLAPIEIRTTDPVLPITGAKISPSPELNGAGGGILEVDYQDGSTRTWDVSPLGELEPRRYAYAFAMVVETDHELSEEERGAMIDGVDFQSLLGATPEYASTPAPIPLNTGNYDEQPAGFGR